MIITDDGDYYKSEADYYYDKCVEAQQQLAEARSQLQKTRNDVHAAMSCAENLFEFIVTELDPDPSDMLRDYLGGSVSDQVWDDLAERYGHDS